MSETFNPYAPPRAEVEVHTGGLAAVEAFPRFSTFAAILLTIFTYGIYWPYWLYSRCRRLSSVTKDNVNPYVIGAMLALFALSFTGGIASNFVRDGAFAIASALLNLGYWIASLVCLFSFRNCYNRLIGAEPGNRHWLGVIATFFLHIFYIQYKINVAIDERRPKVVDQAPGVVVSDGPLPGRLRKR